MPRDLTVGDAHEVMLAVRDTFPRLSREREVLAVVSRALDERDALRAQLAEEVAAAKGYYERRAVLDELLRLARPWVAEAACDEERLSFSANDLLLRIDAVLKGGR